MEKRDIYEPGISQRGDEETAQVFEESAQDVVKNILNQVEQMVHMQIESSIEGTDENPDIVQNDKNVINNFIDDKNKPGTSKSYTGNSERVSPELDEPWISERTKENGEENNFTLRPILKQRTPPLSSKSSKAPKSFSSLLFAREFAKRQKEKRGKSPRQRKSRSYLVKETTSFINLVILFDCISRSSILVFELNSWLFVIYELGVEVDVSHLGRLSQSLTVGLLSCFASYIADSYTGKYPLFIATNIISILTSFLFAIMWSLTGFLSPIVKLIFLFFSSLGYILCMGINPIQTFLVLDQCKAVHDPNSVRRACVFIYWVRNFFELIIYVSVMVFYNIENFPIIFTMVGCSMQLSSLIFFTLMSTKIKSCTFENHAVEKFLVYQTYRKMKRKDGKSKRYSIKHHKTEEMLEAKRSTNKFYTLLYILSPFVLYFIIQQYLNIPWDEAIPGYTDTESQLTQASVKIVFCTMTLTTIPLMELVIFPLLIRTSYNDLKYFGVGVILLGLSLLYSLAIFIHLENEYSGPAKEGTAIVKLVNPIDSVIKLHSDWFETIYLRPHTLSTFRIQSVKNISSTRMLIELKDHNVKYFKRAFIKEMKTSVFMMNDNYKFVRMRGFESHLKPIESYFRLSKLILYNPFKNKFGNCTFTLIEQDKEVVKARRRERKSRFKENLVDTIVQSVANIQIPNLGDQFSIALEPGTYLADMSSLNATSKNITFKSRTIYSCVIDNSSSTFGFKFFNVTDSSTLSTFWDIPAMLLYTLSFNTIMISYTSYVYTQAPHKIKTFTFSMASYHEHISLVPTFIFTNFFSSQTTRGYIIMICLYMLHLFLFIFITVRSRISIT